MKSADHTLLVAVAEGDKQAMTRLYQQYVHRLARFMYRVTQDPGLIEELVNDVMLAVWTQAAEFRGDSAVSTWILGIAYRKAVSATRSQNRYERLIRLLPRPDASEHDLGHLIAERDLNTLMGGLSVEQRAVVDLTIEFGYSYPEIAQILGISVNTVKTRMYYARRKMQAGLRRAGARNDKS